MAETKNCPNCGGDLPKLLAHARMVNCDYCGSSVLLDDEVVELAGEAGVMLDAPELIGLGNTVELERHGIFTAIGHVRYNYGRGHWDEYYGHNMSMDYFWVSVDEGDVAVQTKAPDGAWPTKNPFRLGEEVMILGERYVTTEMENATCAAFRGQLPEPINVGETHLYANLTGQDGLIASAERWDGGRALFTGEWIDPWRVKRA